MEIEVSGFGNDEGFYTKTFSVIGKVKYVGQNFDADLTDGKTYPVIGIEFGFLRIVDDSDEDYLYSATKPGTMTEPFIGGIFEVVEDDENGSIQKAVSM